MLRDTGKLTRYIPRELERVSTSVSSVQEPKNALEVSTKQCSTDEYHMARAGKYNYSSPTTSTGGATQVRHSISKSSFRCWDEAHQLGFDEEEQVDKRQMSSLNFRSSQNYEVKMELRVQHDSLIFAHFVRLTVLLENITFF